MITIDTTRPQDVFGRVDAEIALVSRSSFKAGVDEIEPEPTFARPWYSLRHTPQYPDKYDYRSSSAGSSTPSGLNLGRRFLELTRDGQPSISGLASKNHTLSPGDLS